MSGITASMARYAAGLSAQFAANFGTRFKLIGYRPMTAHPSDGYLFVVIGRREDGTFAMWDYNAAIPCFSHGRYDLDLAQALELFRGRAVKK